MSRLRSADKTWITFRLETIDQEFGEFAKSAVTPEIWRSNNNSCEVVIVDQPSTDETRALLNRIKGAQIIRNEPG